MFKRLLRLLKSKKLCQPESNIISGNTVERKTFTETGDFIKADDFELIWIAKKVNNEYSAADCLDDDEYIDYKLWEDINIVKMYKKHLPKTILDIGKNPNIIFHGGCLGCLSQRNYGLERCKGCLYFRFDPNTNKPDLHIVGEEADTMSADELKKFLECD